MIDQSEINIGDKVIVRGNFGMGVPAEVVVDAIDEKNGRPLIDYRDTAGTPRWAYMHQIDGVVQR